MKLLNKKNILSLLKSKFSIWALILISSFAIIFESDWKFWKAGQNTQFTWDVNSYYSYLPAIILHHDYKFKDNKEYILTTAPNGQKLPKYTFGMAIMYSPFFLLGHTMAIIQKMPVTGFSEPYATAIHYGSIFYVFLGLFFLRKVLIMYFSEAISALTLLCVFFSTNLFHYSMNEGEMSHGYLFCLISISIYYIIKWHEEPKLKYSVILGLLFGLIILIRPNQILFTLVFLFYGVYSIEEFKKKMMFFLHNKWMITLIAAISFLVFLPQLLYWKYLTGHFFYFSYGKEGFFFLDPKIIEVLFSIRKGWLVYTPIMLFSFFGLFLLKHSENKFAFSITIYMILNIYLTSCWWCWWYGGSFGMRPFVDSYPLMAILIASFFQKIFSHSSRRKLMSYTSKIIVTSLILFFTWLNILQTYQYKEFVLHFDGMNRKTYRLIFGKLKLTDNEKGELYANLDKVNYDDALSGKKR